MEGNAWSTIEYLKSFLKEGGLILPNSGALLIVPVNGPPQAFLDSDLFLGNENIYNIDFLGFPRTVLYRSSLGEETWLAEPQPILEYQLMQDKLTDTFQNSVKFSIQQSGKLFGIEFFIEVRIFGNITISSKEQMGYPSWSPIFAPSSYQSQICKGDILRVTVWNEILASYKCKWTLEINATIDSVDKNAIGNIVAKLQEVSGDITLKILRIEPGSLKFYIESSKIDFEEINFLIKKGNLKSIHGFDIKGIHKVFTGRLKEIKKFKELLRNYPKKRTT